MGLKGTVLLDCKWHDDEPLCFVKPGISFDRNITKSISIEVPEWSSHDEENESYKCEFSPPGLIEAVPCNFSPGKWKKCREIKRQAKISRLRKEE